MQIAFEKLDKSLQHALIVSLSLFPKSFRRDAAFATGDDCTKTLTDLKRVLKGGGGGVGSHFPYLFYEKSHSHLGFFQNSHSHFKRSI